MANYGDNYNWQVTFDTSGAGQAQQAVDTIKAVDKATQGAAEAAKYYRDAQGRLRDELGRFVTQARQAELAAQGVAVATKQAGEAAEEAGGGGGGGGAPGRGGKGFAALAGGVMQFAQLAEDAAFGARAIQGNVTQLIATMGGYSPVAMAASGAASILIGVFRDQIDEGLAWAGILDDNLVKGMDRAKDSTEGFAKAQAELLATFPGVTAEIKDQLKALEDLTKQQDGTTAKRLAEQAILEETQYRVGDLRKAQEELAKAEEKAAGVLAMGAQANPAVLQNALFERDEARKRMEAIGVDRQKFAQEGFARQMAGAATSDEAMVKQAERLWDLGQKKGDQGLQDLASAIYKLTDQFKAESEALDASIKQKEEELRAIEKAEKEAEAEAAKSKREQSKAQSKADAEEERRFAGVADSFGSSVEDVARDEMGRGGDQAQAAAEAFQFARDGGASVADAYRMAAEAVRQIVEDQAREAQEFAAQMQALQRQNAARARAQNPWRNNRPNGL